MGKLLEELHLQRLRSHMEGENNLSGKQFGFRKGSPTVDVIRTVVDITKKASRESVKRKGFIALVSIDINNMFNVARWKNQGVESQTGP